MVADDAEAPARGVLRALADLAPSSDQSQGGRMIPLDWFRWLPAGAVRLFGPDTLLPTMEGSAALKALLAGRGDPALRAVRIDSAFAERLATVDQIRVGWL